MQLLAEPKVNFVLYGGAIRGAKTIWLAMMFAYFAIYYPNSRWAIMRMDGPKIRLNLLPSVSLIYSNPEIARFIVDINKTSNTYTFANGSVIQLFAESHTTDKDMTRFHGLEVNGFGLDELPEFQEQTWRKCFERAGAWLNAKPGANGKKPRPMVLATANPTKNWVKTEIYDKWFHNILPKTWRYIQARVFDNPYVPQSYLDNLKENMTPENYERFVGGDWEYVDANGHEWLHKFNYTTHVRSVPYLNKQSSFLTFDFNVWPYMTLLCFQLEELPEIGGYRVRFYDEFCLSHPDNSAEAVCKAWIKKYPNVYGQRPVSYCGDASGESNVPGFGSVKAFNPVRATLAKYLHDSSNLVYRKEFFNEFVRKFVNDMLDGHLPVEIWIDENNCKKLIKDIQVCLEDPKGGFVKVKVVDPKTKIKYEQNGHCVDAMKYGLLSVFSQTYEEKYHRKNGY